ncbi:MAG: DNA methylase [Lachnospiraceae bacterium]|nr:DNA methylase [Lachnospiraceae bacterium]
MSFDNHSAGHTYVAIDLKSFYASVECRDRGLDPLTAKLVVADPTRTDKTICLAVTPALKAYGISGRARVFEVNHRLEEVEKETGEKVEYIMAPPRMARYVEISTKIFEVYMRYISPEDIHVYSIDECFMDVTQYMKLYKLSARELTVKMIREVLAETGITATAGIATNLYLCKIAMDIVAKHATPDEDGVRIAELDEKSYRQLLWGHRPITDFWRVGPGIARRLSHMGIYTMGDIARTSVADSDSLYKEMGKDAEILIDHAWGYEPCGIEDIKSYEPSTESLTSGQVLMEPYDFKKARLIVQEMTDLLVLDMVEKGLVTDSFTLAIGYDRSNMATGDYKGEVKKDHFGRDIPKGAHGSFKLDAVSSSTRKIMAGMVKLYDEIADKKLLVRRITICANNLMRENYSQVSLFDNVQTDEKERKMQETMITLKHKFGKNAVLKGMNLSEGGTTILRNNQIGGHKA